MTNQPKQFALLGLSRLSANAGAPGLTLFEAILANTGLGHEQELSVVPARRPPPQRTEASTASSKYLLPTRAVPSEHAHWPLCVCKEVYTMAEKKETRVLEIFQKERR